MRVAIVSRVVIALLGLPLVAGAQQPPPDQAPTAPAVQQPPPGPPPGAQPVPPPGWGAPPPGWVPPPPGWQPPPGWGPPREMPEELPYDESQPIPPGYHVETSMRKGPLIAGSVLLGTGYLIAASTAAATVSDSDGQTAPLFIPVVGPFITLGTLDFSGDFGGLAFVVIGLPLIVDGLIQTAGAILLTVGLTSERQYLQRNDLGATDTTPKLRVGPSGVALHGAF